ncbi:AmmeMemoRadiSam system protein B [Chloroflexota bacterium]
MTSILDTRPSPIAGQWYPADASQLAAQVDSYVNAAQLPELEGEVVAVMAPHAGYTYSGPVAGYAFAALRGLTPEVVALISPMHYPYNEPLLTTAHSAYATPLGEVPVDHNALKALDSLLLMDLGYGLTRVAHDSEHSLEIELPFLQRVLEKPFRLLPVMVRDPSARVVRGLGKALAVLFSEGGLLAAESSILVASTDLSHFYPQSVANELDGEMLRHVEAFDPDGVLSVEDKGKGFACGRGALSAVLWAARGLGADHVEIVNYATSGDITGDLGSVVGYGAAVVTRQDK